MTIILSLRRHRHFPYWPFFILSVATSLLLTSCSEEKLFVSDFDHNTVGSPPAAAQKVGTISDVTPNKVVIATSPISVAGNWAKTERTGIHDAISGFTCNNSKFIGDGEYRFSATFFIPRDAGLVTIDFEPDVPPGGSFLHIDFLKDNNGVRLQDAQVIPGMRYPRDSIFIAQVTLKISAAQGTAHIALGGVGTQGTFDYTMNASELHQAHRFTKTALFMGDPWTGSFYTTNIVVTHNK